MSNTKFKFIDLFAGVGGFHGAMHMLGGECVFASEIDANAVQTYENNWHMKVFGDINKYTDDCSKIPNHDVLCAGFPCQPFSKSGNQRGMNETRGTLFFNIAKILEKKSPSLFILENVRNLAGPRHRHEWETIILTLRGLGYAVNSKPLIVSPHLLPKKYGGRPQIRERVLILGYKETASNTEHLVETSFRDNNKVLKTWSPQEWNLYDYVDSECSEKYLLSDSENEWLDVWNDFILAFYKQSDVASLPSFPIWFDDLVSVRKMEEKWEKEISSKLMPKWKFGILAKNAEFYESNKQLIERWKERNPQIFDFPLSRRKLEWQAQDAKSLNETIVHFRPSGIRAKKPTYAPALVAITQTTVLGKERRRLTPRETARLQAFPEWFSFSGQDDAASYKQMGNAVNINIVYWAFKSFLNENLTSIQGSFPEVSTILENAIDNPDDFMWK